MGTEYQPDYVRVMNDIQQKITSGEWPPGHRLPSITELAQHYRVSKTTVKDVQKILRIQGVLFGHQGRGVFVAEVK